MSATIFGIPNHVNGIPNRKTVLIANMKTIGARVRAARLKKGMSLKDLAAAVGIAPGTLADLESGRSKKTTVLHLIAAELGVNIADLDLNATPSAVSDKGHHSASERKQTIDSIQGNNATNSQVSRLDPSMIRDAYKVVDNFFTTAKGVFKVDVDPDLLARGYEWAQTQNPALLASIDADVRARVSERRVRDETKREVGKGAGRKSASRGR